MIWAPYNIFNFTFFLKYFVSSVATDIMKNFYLILFISCLCTLPSNVTWHREFPAESSFSSPNFEGPCYSLQFHPVDFQHFKPNPITIECFRYISQCGLMLAWGVKLTFAINIYKCIFTKNPLAKQLQKREIRCKQQTKPTGQLHLTS